MNMKNHCTGYAAVVGMLILILDSKTALEGAQEGIILCVKTVIPSLFPFFILTFLLTNAFHGLTPELLRPIRSWCNLPAGSEAVLISGYLGGYPVGAQCIAQTYNNGGLRKEDAQRMLGFCNNAGPAFLFGMVGPMFSEGWMAWALWIIHITSALAVARILPGAVSACHVQKQSPLTLADALEKAIHTMALVCGWVIFFRVIVQFLNRWLLWACPVPIRIMLAGVLELSNGCYCLQQIENESLRFILASVLIAGGGLCVTMQTISVTRGLSLRFYYWGKILQTLVSLLLSWSVISGSIVPLLLCLLASFPLFRKKQKKCSIPRPLRV